MTSDMENREWLDNYTSLKQVNTNNPFTVPNGYFDELGERIITSVKFDELKNKLSPDGFAVPPNYFEELSDKIQSRLIIEDALNAENHGFTTPENYFEELNNNIQSRVAIEDALSTDAGFTVPENYFNELSSKMQSRLVVEQALNGADDTFTVPQDYFSELNKKILNKTVNQDIVKRKGAVIRMISSTAFKYATAACLVLMLGTGIFLRQFTSATAEHDRSFLHTQLSNVSVDEIQSYLDENVDANDTQHTVADENLPVNDADLKAALQDYTNNQ